HVFCFSPPLPARISTLSLHDALPISPHRRGIGYVFQDARLFPHLTVRQNLLYGHWFTGRGRQSDLDRVTEMLGIGPLLSRRPARSEEHTSELQSRENLVCRLLLEKKK